MKKSKKAIFLLGVILLIFLFFLHKKWPDESMKVTFCDVDQGDSVLIQQDFFQVIVDSGKDDRLLGCLGHFLPIWDRTIEVFIMTHGDEDHVGFFGEILGLFDVKFIFFPDTSKDTQVVRGLKEAIRQEEEKGAVVKQPILGQSVNFPSGGKITFLKLPEDVAWEETENDRSIVFLLEYQETKWLFMGDLEEKGEFLLGQYRLFPRVDVLKVGHHGSGTSSTMDFLRATQPEVAVISAGRNNKYGHPDPTVLENLSVIGSRVLRTDQLGDIELVTEDGQIWLQSTLQRE